MRYIVLLMITISTLGIAQKNQSSVAQEAKDFLAIYNALYQKLTTVSSNAQWGSSTDVSEQHTGERIGADKALAAFIGNAQIIEKCRSLLKRKKGLDKLTIRQLDKILLNAAHYPGTIPDVVTERVTAEANQSAILDGFRFCYTRVADSCAEFTTPNKLQEVLSTSTNLAERKHAWEVSKQTGSALRPGLAKLQALRNRMGQEMGFRSYFDLEVRDYGMQVPEMMTLLEKSITETRPLYEQLHYWAKKKLAERYKQPVPNRIPAHWLGNRWSQAWPGIVEGVDLDNLFKGKKPEWIIQQAERF